MFDYAWVPPKTSAHIDHHALVSIQEDVMNAFNDASVQKRMIDVFNSTASYREKKKKHSEVCLEYWFPILSKYGFEVSQSGMRVLIAHFGDPMSLANSEIRMNAAFSFWLQHWMEFKAPSPWDGRVTDSCVSDEFVGTRGFAAYVANADDRTVIRGIDICRQRLVSAHKELYEKVYPDVELDAWSRLMGLDNIREDLNKGTLILYAAAHGTGEVIGYISCAFEAGQSADSEQQLPKSREPYTQIHHIVVLPTFESRGVGKVLFHELQAHLSKIAPGATSDMRLNVLELNARAAYWYLRLGFAVTGLFAATLHSSSLGDVPVVLCRMGLKRNILQEVVAPCLGEELCFGEQVCSEQVYVVPSNAPLDFIFSLLYSGHTLWTIKGMPPATILAYVATSGLHLLDDGRQVDLSNEFSRGYAFFVRPLHAMELGLQEEATFVHAL